MAKENLECLVIRVGKKYVQATMPLKITIGEILAGKIELNYGRNKKGDEHNSTFITKGMVITLNFAT